MRFGKQGCLGKVLLLCLSVSQFRFQLTASMNCYDYLFNNVNVIDYTTVIPTPEKVETILAIVGPLICDQRDVSSVQC